ncbi:MAG TPA: hypothetical protein VMV19_14000 [Xanthobacteraceae bacterium]|nr:hypothetical protein [Xanthobacteraceae bacterium]
MRKTTLCCKWATLSASLAAVWLAGAIAIPGSALAQTASPQVESTQPVISPVANNPTQPSVAIGDLVQSTTGGTVMRVRSINGGQAICHWKDDSGQAHQEKKSVAQLIVIAGPLKNEDEFKEPGSYHPCPANVIRRGGGHQCLG